MTATLELINAISTGDASATQDAFNAAMAEKISAKLDDMRVSVAQRMFNVQEDQPAVEGETGQEEQE
jgi:hypothetical protein